MANMLTTGISGLNAAQIALTTVGNNIANAGTDGYSRQTISQVERISQQAGKFTIGNGVDVASVQRSYSEYLTTAMWSSNASLSRASTFNDLTTTLNSVLSGSGDMQGSLDSLYAAFSTVANAPSTSSARQSLLGNAASTATMFNTLGQQMAAQQTSVNKQISSTVDSINSATSAIASLNKQIKQVGGGATPNDLLDQRDALVNQLSGLVGVNAVTESDGTMSVYTTAGQTIVTGASSFNLKAGPDAYDATRTNITDTAGNDITTKLSGGSLGAMLDYRTTVLDPAQNALGQAALALASSVNAQQAKGLDLNGSLGSPIFSVGSPAVSASSRNTGSAVIGASISDVSATTSSAYVMTYNGASWNLKTTSGQNVALTSNPDGTYSADGMTFSVSGAAVAGDSYKIQPSRNAAGSLSVAMTDPSGIAAAAALTTTAAAANTGAAKVGSVSVTDPSNAAALAGATISFTSATAYTITDAGGATIGGGTYTPGQPITANGWSVTLSGAPATGDSFGVAKNASGLNDNSNALKMAALSDSGVLSGGKVSVVDAYANLTTQIGSAGAQASTNLTTQTALHDQAVSAQQSVSGVNIDEEGANLVKYQQSYQASAQVIAAAQTIFTSLMNALG
jgi:flagellar hook-associated protein 1